MIKKYNVYRFKLVSLKRMKELGWKFKNPGFFSHGSDHSLKLIKGEICENDSSKAITVKVADILEDKFNELILDEKPRPDGIPSRDYIPEELIESKTKLDWFYLCLGGVIFKIKDNCIKCYNDYGQSNQISIDSLNEALSELNKAKEKGWF